MSNCWAKWWYDFVHLKNRIKKLPWVKPYKLDSLFNTAEKKACNPHDKRADIWWGIFAYIKSNYIFAVDLMSIMRFTTVFGRLTIFLLAFIWTCLWWIRTYNWTNVL